MFKRDGMLVGISPVIGLDLHSTLYRVGHGDEMVGAAALPQLLGDVQNTSSRFRIIAWATAKVNFLYMVYGFPLWRPEACGTPN